MEIQIVIFLIIATIVYSAIAQGSFAAKSSDSCVPQTNIGADLAVVQFGEDTAHHGLQRAAVIIFTEIKSTLARRAQGIRTKTKDEDLKTANALDEVIIAFEVGIIPTLEALRTIQPAVDMDSGRDKANRQLERIAVDYFRAIELTQNKSIYNIQAKIKAIDNDTQAAGTTLITQLFTTIRNGTVKIPADADPTIDCIQKIVSSEILDAIHYVIDGIRLLVDDVCAGKKAGGNDCLSAVQATQDKVTASFKSEVTLKYSVIRNILIAQLLKKIGVVPGLFAVQAAQAAQAATSG